MKNWSEPKLEKLAVSSTEKSLYTGGEIDDQIIYQGSLYTSYTAGTDS